MTALESRLIQRLKVLPPERVAEVADFVEFLASRVQRDAAAQRLSDAVARLDALGLPPISDDEIEAEVQASRRERSAAQEANLRN
jgi:hypothetical protein